MILIHRGRLKLCWRNYQRLNKLSNKQMANTIGCPINEVKTLLQSQPEQLNTPYYQNLVDLFGEFIYMDYKPPLSFRTFISNSNRFQVSELDLQIKPRYSDIESEKSKLEAFVNSNQNLFAKNSNYALAIQICEDVDKKYIAYRRTH